MIRVVVTVLLFLSAPAWAVPRLAIASIENHTGDETLNGAGHGVAAVLTSKFSRVDAVDIVERDRMATLLQEIELSSSGLVDPASAAEAGKVLGADYLVFGSLVSARLPALAMILWVVDVETGEVIASQEVRGQIGDNGEEFFVMIDELAFAILDVLQLRLAARDRIAFGEVEVRQLSTVDVYGRALDAIDSGDGGAAKQLLSRAVTLEPEFTLAEEALTRLAAEVSSRKSAWAHEAIEASHASWKKLEAHIEPVLQVADPGPKEFAHLALVARFAQMRGDFETYFEMEEKRIELTTTWLEANRPETERPGDYPRKFHPHSTFRDGYRDALTITGNAGQRESYFYHLEFWPWEIKEQLAETLFSLGEREQALALAIENYQFPGPTHGYSEHPPHPFDVSEDWQPQAHVAFAQQRVRQAELGGVRDELIVANKELGEALSRAASSKEDREEYEAVMRKLTRPPSDVDALADLLREERNVVDNGLVRLGYAIKGYQAFLARVDSGFYDALRSHDKHSRSFGQLADEWHDAANAAFRPSFYRELKLQHLLTFQEQVPPEDDERAERYRRTLEESITSWYRQ